MDVIEERDAPGLPGDQADFCRREHPRLVASMPLYTGDPDLAAELAQEALARACRDWSHVRRADMPAAWTHRVAVNLANSHFRRRRYESLARDRARAQLSTPRNEPEPPLGCLLRETLLRLPRRQREAVVLRYLLDCSVEATARHMSCAEGTVRALTSQAIKALRTNPDLADLRNLPDD